MKVKTFLILIIVLSILSAVAMPIIALCFSNTEASTLPKEMTFEPLATTPTQEPVETITFAEIDDTVKQNILISVYDDDENLEKCSL